MGGRGGERGRDKIEKQREEPMLTRKGSQLTRKQRKVSKQLWCRTVPMPWSMEGSGIIESLWFAAQRLKAERELDRDLREAEATESREKKTKFVSGGGGAEREREPWLAVC